jgi:1,2-phenylacetyl-CoA epoxidase catalytic subunit
MPVKREIEPRAVEAADIAAGRADPRYVHVLVRLLEAHAIAEKLTAFGYERALSTVQNSDLKPVIKKNMVEERKHARLVYRALRDLGVSEKAADRAMLPLMRQPSFAAPRYFAERARGDLDLAMASLALDATGLIMIGVNYKDSSYAPHARAAEVILEEEADHEVFASELLSEAVGRAGKLNVIRALRAWLPRAVNFFGPPGSGFTYDCLRFGLKSRDNDELAELYLAMLERRVESLGLTLPKLTREYPHAVV